MLKNFFLEVHKVILYFLVAFLLSVFLKYMTHIGSYVGLEDIKSVNSQIADTQVSIKSIEKNIEDLSVQYKDIIMSSSNADDTKNKLLSEISEYKLLAGYMDVYGEGIVVIIDDADRNILIEENPASLMVHDLDIRLLVNELQNAGAEAISVNGQRLIQGITRIQCVGPTISINDIKQSQPYTIKAIGDRFKLHNALNTYQSIATKLKQAGLKVYIETQKYIRINRYR